MDFGFSAWAVPIITNVEPTSLSDSTFVVTWSTTNEDSTTEILYGAGALTNVVTIAAQSSTKFHYLELTGLYQNTTYQYRVKSGSTTFPPAPLFSPLSFTTLPKPSGEYLFSFAVLNDLRYARGKDSTQSARGIPYAYCSPILTSEVNEINGYVDPNGGAGVAFTVLNGNIVDSDTATTYGDQASSEVQPALEVLRAKPSDLTSIFANKYMPVPGFRDKANSASKAAPNSYTTDWITNSFKPLTSSTSIESVYGYNAASKDADSVFNYQFEYNKYNFIFLDSVKAPTKEATGSVDLTKVYNFINGSGLKTFIFMSYPAYDPFSSADNTKDYPVDIPTSEVGGALYISNHGAFRSTLETFTDASTNKIVAAVISGHLGDNYNRTINAISYIRQGPALQYPTGYSIYKVYSTGFVKTFYKVKARDAAGKPYYELARDQISAETVSSQLLGKDALAQFWLGSSSNRNFTQQYAFIPGLTPKVIATGPASNETNVTLNAPILITFNKRMAAASNLTSWATIRDSNGNSVSVTSASFVDSSRTILSLSHPDFSADTTYTVTVVGANAVDEGSTTMASNYAFSFNTFGGTKDVAPPTSSIDPLPSNSTSDPFPNFTGIATDSARVIVVEYRFDNKGSWTTAEAVQGKFSGVTEIFQIKAPSPLSAGSHQLWLRTYDGIGNTSAEGYMAYPFTVVIGDKPTTSSVKFNRSSVYAGDPIRSLPKIEITITSINSLESGRINFDSTRIPLTFVKVDTTYYATYEITAALAEGTHAITIEAFDVNGNASTYEVASLYVQAAADVIVQSTPLNYPNPFDPGAQPTTIGYMLSKDAAITLTIHDLAGNQLVKKSFASGDNGGKTGYNTTTWDGKTDGGDYVGNGIYVYLIIGDGKVLSKGKLTVLKR